MVSKDHPERSHLKVFRPYPAVSCLGVDLAESRSKSKFERRSSICGLNCRRSLRNALRMPPSSL
jgi:hypothetical protein